MSPLCLFLSIYTVKTLYIKSYVKVKDLQCQN